MYQLFEDAFLADPYLSTLELNVSYYVYPETDDIGKDDVYIVVDPITPPVPTDYADGRWVAEEHYYFVEVYTKSHALTSQVARKVQDILNDQFLFRQFGGGVDEYDQASVIFRDMRKYRGKKIII